MTAADLSTIREHTDIRQLVQSYGVKLKVYARVGTGLCPLHSEKTPSFRVNLPGHQYAGKWRCHGGCGVGGDCFDLVMRLDSCDLPTAARRLAADAGLTLSNRPETALERRQRESDREEKILVKWWYRQAWSEARRGLNRAMRAMDRGNPFAEDCAGIYGRRLRWIELNAGTEAGLERFRLEDRATVEKAYRIWMCRDLRRYATAAELTGLVIRTWEYQVMHADGWPSHPSTQTNFPVTQQGQST